MIILKRKNTVGNFSIYISGHNKFSIFALLKRQVPNKYWDRKERQYIISPYCYYDLIDMIKEFFPAELIITEIELESCIIDMLGIGQQLLEIQQEGLMNDGSEIIKMPESFSEDEYLPPYQQAGVKYLLTSERSIEGDVVGLGKTVISMTAAMKLMEKHYDYCLVVCPATLKLKWKKDIEKFYPDSKIQLIEGLPKKRTEGWNGLKDFHFSIVNYDILYRDEEAILGAVNGNAKNILICDEIQYCKNHNAKRSIITKKISELFKKVFGLSASYMENSLMDLHSVMQITRPDVLGTNMWSFESRHVEKDFFGNIKEYKNVEEVIKKVAPFIIRRHKEQVFEQLPERIEIDYWVKLSPLQKKFYNDVLDRITTMIADMTKARKVRMASVLTQIGYLKQACLSTELLGSSTGESSKLSELINIMESLDKDSRVLIFCFYTKMVDIITEELRKKGYKTISLHGQSVKVSERQPLIDRFNEDKSTKAIVVSDALRTGVDITGANCLINFDLLYNPRAMEQRSGRIDRIGQESSKITVMNIIAQDTIEEVIYDRLKDKDFLWQTITGNFKSSRTTKMNLNTIKELLRLK